MRIPLDRESSMPLYRQIEDFLREQIHAGALPPEMRLPSSRELADDLGVNRITVTNAYAELEADGMIYSRPGSGTYVAAPLAPPLTSGSGEVGEDNWPLWQQELLTRAWLTAWERMEQMQAVRPDEDEISFAGGSGAQDMFPADEFRRTLQSVLRRDGAVAMGYGDEAGYPPLRTTIAHILANQGIPAYPDQVLITSGSQQAIALVANLLLRPGDVVLVESPTYSAAIDLFYSTGALIVGVEMDGQGMRTDSLEAALQTHHPQLLYTIPTFHNPTGVCMSGHRRRQLIALADLYNVPILEDDFVGDLRYDGRAQPALKALDPGGRVIYVSTFSKMLMPGLRAAFLVASGPVYESLLIQKRITDLATSDLIQRALEAYITVGRYRSHLRRSCRTYSQRLDAMLEALARWMPEGASWQAPKGGLFIWLRLPNGLSADELLPVAAEEGAMFAPGSLFFPAERTQPYVRLNFTTHPPERIEEGIRRLGRAVERCLSEIVTVP
jgi:GntR family transcriptional regulator/MocR family aminotransferase